MKRLTSVLLVLIMCVSALSACSGAPVKQTESVTESVTATARPKAKLSELKKKIDLAYFKGITLITKDGETVLNYSTGKTAATNGKKVDENTAFCIASVTKQFTAAAIMLLKEKGLLSLDDTIDLYFPDYKLGKKNTIHNLLSMRSGIPDYIHEEAALKAKYGVKKHNRYRPNRAGVEKWIFDQKLEFKPGKYYQYSNSNYLLLTEIVEQVSGMNYGAYLRKHFFKPLNMTSSGFIESYDKKSDKFAKPLREVGNEAMSYRGVAFGAGNVISTAADLAKWLDALDGGQVVNAESFKEMTTTYTTEADQAFGYGYGMMIENADRYFHLGNIPSYSSYVAVDKKSHLHLVMLTNADDDNIETLGNTLLIELGND